MTKEDVIKKAEEYIICNPYNTGIKIFLAGYSVASQELAGREREIEKLVEALEKINNRCRNGLYDATDTAFVEMTAIEALTQYKHQ